MRLGIFCALDHHPAEGGPTPREAFRHAIAEAVAADAGGLESYWVAEHHFAPYGLAADPAVLLAAVGERTARLRLGTATAVLPLQHPLRTAETYAQLDQLCGGRLEFGVGSGYLQYEFEAFGLDPEPGARRARFDEALAVIRQAWTGQPVRHFGAHFRIEAPALHVLPLQTGGPPVHIGVTRPEAAPHVGRQGLPIALVPYIRIRSLEELEATVAAYRALLPAGAVGGVTVAVHAFCAAGRDDPDLVAAEAALALYLRTRVVPGARYGGGPVCRDFVLFGDAEQVRSGLARLGEAGADRVLALTSFGNLAPALALGSVQRLARLARATPRGPVAAS